jgi:hypothetical protein
VEAASELLKVSNDLRDMWQGRALAAASGRMMLVVSSLLAQEYDEAMAVLFRLVEPLCWDPEKQSLRAPFLCGCGKIDKEGRIVADAIMFDGAIKTPQVMFTDLGDYEYELRKLADRTRMSDAERLEFFIVARKWVVADRRLDPTMDPRDPDARRLLH